RALANGATKGNSEVDWSTIDFRVSQRMVLAGWSIEQIQRAIEEGSPNIGERKGAALSSYASRTAQKAAESDVVQRELQRRALEQKALQQAQKQQEGIELPTRSPAPRMR